MKDSLIFVGGSALILGVVAFVLTSAPFLYILGCIRDDK
jgi:hypothetical protein